MNHILLKRWSALVTVFALLASLVLVLFPVLPAQAAERDFENVFSVQEQGAITITGNTLQTCDQTYRSCRVALNSGNPAYSNNSVSMYDLDLDDDASTHNSSSADVTMPAGSEVLFAGLFWGATPPSKNAVGRNTIKFKVPNGKYEIVEAAKFDAQTSRYYDFSAYADVTQQVKKGGSGTYWGADVVAIQNRSDRYAGWALIVVYKNESLPLRDMQVFSGYKLIKSIIPTDVKISGFLTPARGEVKAEIGTVVYEGDGSISGDQMLLDDGDGNFELLSDDLNEPDNYFRTRVTDNGKNRTDRNPAFLNNLALDAKTVDASGYIKNGATSTTARFQTDGDYYYPAAFTTQIDLDRPEIVGNKTVTTETGNEKARVGEKLTYTVNLKNTGQDDSDNTVFTDTMPTGTQYVPGTMSIKTQTLTDGAVTSENTVTPTDGAGDDVAEVVGEVLTARIGEGANSSTGGRMNVDPQTVVTLTFQVVVTEEGADSIVTNEATTSYEAVTGGKEYSEKSNSVGTPVYPLADVSLTKTGPGTITAGEEITWTLEATNAGPDVAANVKVRDTLPDGITFVSSESTDGSSCYVKDQEILCELEDLVADASTTITLTGLVSADAKSIGDTLTNVAQISTSTPEPLNDDNNGANHGTTLQRSADIALEKTVSPASIAPGETATFTLTVTNNGPSSAEDVEISDTMPDGLTVQSATWGSADTGCSIAGQDVSCAVGTLAPSATETATVKVKLAEDWDSTEPVTNSSSATSSTPDPNTDNNSDQATLTPTRPIADLSIEKSTTTNPVKAGKSVTYQVVVTNDGPSQAQGVKVSDELAEEFSNVQADTADGTCTVTDNTVNCELGTIASKGTKTVTVTADLASSATGSISNTAEVQSTSTDPNPDNDSSTVSNDITTQADLSITKTAGSANAGEDLTYTLAVKNNGTADALNVSMTDQLPDGVTFVSATGDGATCTESTGTVTCNLETVANQATKTITVTVHVPANAAENATFENSASVSSDTPDDNPDNNKATATATTGTDADLRLEKSGPASATAGEPITWTITVTNDGPSDAVNTVVTDTLPEAIEDGAQANITNGAAGSCTVSGHDLTCDLTTLPAQKTAEITVTGTVDSDYNESKMTNTASVSSDTSDPAPDNNSDDSVTPVNQAADLSIQKSGPAEVTAGETAEWELTISNAGPSTARTVAISDVLPEGVTFKSVSSDSVTCEPTGRVVNCSLDQLASGSSASVTITGTVASNVGSGETLTNSASVSADTPEPVDATGPNSAESETRVETSADLSVTKSVDPTPLISGASAQYAVTVTNDGPSSARAVKVTDNVPDGLTPTRAQGADSCEISGQDVTCSYASIDSGAERTFYISVDVTLDATSTATNTVSVSSDTTEANPDNNTFKLETPVEARADLVIKKTQDRDTIAPGESLIYSLMVTNLGPSTATDVTVTDAIPEGMTFVKASDGCQAEADTVTCAVDDMAYGDMKSVMITLRVPADSTINQVSNTASVSSADVPDPNSDNNSSTVSADVIAKADVSIKKTADPTDVVAGDTMTWTLEVTNAGPSVARDVKVTDSIPDGLSIVSADLDGSDCVVEGQDATCSIGDMAVGARTITVETTVDAGYTEGSIENTATVSSTTPDPNGDNNSSKKTVSVTSAADIAVEKVLSSEEAVPGETVTYTVTVTNNGLSDAAGVVVTDLVPVEITDVSASGSGPAGDLICSVADPADPATSSADVSCTVGALAVGEVATITVSGTLDSAFTGSLSNTATASADTTDPNEDNNTSTATTDVKPKADLILEKTASVADVAPGNTVDYALKVTNNGPSVATTVTISDGIPTGTEVVSYDDRCAVTEQPSGRSLICQVGDLAVGESTTAPLTLKIPANSTANEIVNDAATSSGVDDPDTSNNGSTATVTVSPQADVSVVKSMDPSAVTPGESVTYTVVATNDGPSVARDVHVKDSVPTGLEIISATLDDDTECAVTGQDIDCLIGDMPVGSRTVTIAANIAADYTSDSVVNTATASSDTPDPDESNNSSSVTGTSTPKADVSIVKTMAAANPVPGESVTFTLDIANAGPSVASNVSVADTLPAGLSDVTVSNSDGVTCSVAEAADSPGDMSCAITSLPVKGVATVTVTATVDADFTGDLTNTASASSDTPDPDDSNNSSTVTGTSLPKADVSVVKSMDPSAVTPGESVTYTVVATNDGPSVARDVHVKDSVPTGLEIISATLDDDTECAVTGQDIDCLIGDMPVGSRTVTIAANIAADYTSDSVVNTATASSDTPDPDESNNSSSVTGTSIPKADLVLEKIANATEIAAGESVSYALKVTNNGPSVATNVVVADGLPTGMVLDSYDDTCEISASGENVICKLGTLAVGSSATANLTFTVPSDSTTSEFTNTAATSSAVTDPDPSNNGSSATVGVTTSADVSIIKSAPDTVIAGDTITWNLEVSNSGPSVARSVNVSDALPANVVFDSATGAECSEADGQLTCALGDLDPNDPVTIAVTGTVDSDAAAGALENSANVSTNTPDPNEDNNTSTSTTEIIQSADVVLGKTVSDDSIAPGESVTYTLTATNNGLSTARDVVISDELPDGLTVTSATATAGDACTITSNTVSCEVGDLTVSDTATATVVATLAETWNATDPIVNAGQVSASTTDPNPENNTSSATFTPIDPVSDVSIVKTTVDSPVAGGNVTYRLSVSNAGPSLARDVTVSDTLPEGLSKASASVPDGECTVDDRQINCNLPDLAAGATAQVTVTAEVASSVTGDLTNAAEAGTSSTDPDESNNTSSVTDTVETSADLAIVKTAGEAVAGSDLTYTLTVTNNGVSDARNAIITDAIPANVDFVSVAGDGCTEADDTVTCDLGTVAAGASATATITVHVPSDVTNAAEIANTATIHSDTPDPDESNNKATATSTTDTSADLAITKSGPAQVVAGESVEWTLTVTNGGPSDAVNATVADTLPDAIESGASVELADGAPGSCGVNDHSMSCDLGTLTSGGKTTIVVTGTVKSGFNGDAVTNSATVTSDTPDPTDSNNSSSSTTSIKQVADLNITKSGPTEVVAGESATWTLAIGNTGPSTARTVVVSDTLPEGVTFDSYTSEEMTCEVVDSAITCDLAELAAGAQATVEITGTIDPGAVPSTMTNTATVSSDTPEPDGGQDNNSSSSSTEVTAEADLGVLKSVNPSPLTAGETGKYTITVTNAGPSVARNVVITDTLPDDLTADQVQGPGTCEINDQVVTCTFASIAPQASNDIYLTVTVDGSTLEMVTNTVAVSSDTPDPNMENNEFSLETPIDSYADVSVIKTMDPASVVPGESVTYTIIASNAGPSTAADVVVEDILPAGLSWVSAHRTSAEGDVPCDETTADDGTSQITCTIGQMTPGEEVSITVTAVVNADLTGELTNTATASTTTEDPDETNNSATVTGALTPQADLAVTKKLMGKPQAGGEIHWHIGVISEGPSVATNVTVIDELPESMRDARVKGNHPECSIEANVLTCVFATIAPNNSIDLDVVGELDSETDGTVTNVVTVSSDTSDPNTDNNEASAQGSVIPRPETALAITGVDLGPQALGALALFVLGFLFVGIRRRQES